MELWQPITFELLGKKVFDVTKVKPSVGTGKQSIILGLSTFMEVSTDSFVHTLMNHGHNVRSVAF